MKISTTSFHYRYYTWIRRVWGFDRVPAASLCPYFHAMLWGSIFAVVLSPVLVFGWFCMKLGRIACKFQNPGTDWIVEVLDRRTEWMTRLNDGPSNFSKSPLTAGMMWSVGGLMCVVMGALVLLTAAAFFGGIGYGIWNISYIFLLVFSVVAALFTLPLWVSYFLGFGFIWGFNQAVLLFTNGPLWYGIGSWAVYLLAWLLGAGVVAVFLCFVGMNLTKVPALRRFGAFLTNRFNGFSEAQQERVTRRKRVIRALPDWKCGYCNYKANPADWLSCQECVRERKHPESRWRFLLLPLYPLARSLGWVGNTYVKVRNTEISIVGPFNVLWTYLVAIKKGICPLIEFVNPVLEQANARAAAQERMDRESQE